MGMEGGDSLQRAIKYLSGMMEIFQIMILMMVKLTDLYTEKC